MVSNASSHKQQSQILCDHCMTSLLRGRPADQEYPNVQNPSAQHHSTQPKPCQSQAALAVRQPSVLQPSHALTALTQLSTEQTQAFLWTCGAPVARLRHKAGLSKRLCASGPKKRHKRATAEGISNSTLHAARCVMVHDGPWPFFQRQCRTA